jgi:hypothetical protein
VRGVAGPIGMSVRSTSPSNCVSRPPILLLQRGRSSHGVIITSTWTPDTVCTGETKKTPQKCVPQETGDDWLLLRGSGGLHTVR